MKFGELDHLEPISAITLHGRAQSKNMSLGGEEFKANIGTLEEVLQTSSDDLGGRGSAHSDTSPIRETWNDIEIGPE